MPGSNYKYVKIRELIQERQEEHEKKMESIRAKKQLAEDLKKTKNKRDRLALEKQFEARQSLAISAESKSRA